MATVAIFDEGATPQRVLSVLVSVHTPDYDTRTDVVINPDLSLLEGIVPIRFWKHVAGAIVEYTQAEKDAQDAAEAAAADLSTREGAKSGLAGFQSQALLLRALADVIKDEINILRGQWVTFQAEVAAANNLSSLKAGVASMPALSDRTLAQLRTAIESRVDGGTVDS